MENRNPRLNLSIIPVEGVDRSVNCSDCPAACCREGMILPLSGSEAAHLQAAGTELHRLDKGERGGNRPPFRHAFYRLETACGNLAVNAVTGETSCRAYGNSERPKICGQFKMGGFACVATQLERIETGQDQHLEE